MKLLFENWREYLLKEQSELWNYKIQSEQKIFVSSEPFSNLQNIQQKKPSHAMDKPKGLWYGCGDSWIEWVRGEMPHWLEKANYLYEVKLGEEIIQISNDDEFGNFHAEFGFTPQDAYDPRSRAINWKEIQEQDYNGVEICPYLWERRQEDWYYGWDVASGCIWNSAGISDIVLLAEKETINEITI